MTVRYKQVTLNFTGDEIRTIRELPGSSDKEKILMALALAVRSFRAAKKEKAAPKPEATGLLARLFGKATK